MSRIGIKPIALASTVEVKVDGGSVSVKGPLGQLGWELADGIDVTINGGAIQVDRRGNAPRVKALHGLTRVELANLVEGVTKGFERTLELTGVGYRAQVQGQSLTLNVGFAHPVTLSIPEGVPCAAFSQRNAK